MFDYNVKPNNVVTATISVDVKSARIMANAIGSNIIFADFDAENELAALFELLSEIGNS